ncbi:MAG: elongation factor P, partial [Shewanella sp.]
MKTAHEIRPGNVIMLDGSPWVVQKTETTRSGRNAAIVKMKLKHVLIDSGTETTFKGEDKMDVIVLERLDCTYSYYADPMYVFMDSEYNQYDVEADNMGDAAKFIVDGMEE